MRYQLTYLDGPNKGLTVELNQDEVYIGRNVNNDIVINEPHISGQHAELESRGNQVLIKDLGSTNGTFVNGRRLTSPVTLNAGDTLRFGTEIRMSFSPIPEDFSDRTVVGTPEELPAYSPVREQAPFQAAPKKKSFPIWIVFVVLAIILLCGGVILLGGGGLVALNLFNNPESQTQQAIEAAMMETDQAVLQATQIAMTQAPIATETAQAQQAMTRQAQQATAAAIEYYWGIILDAMGTNPLYGPASGTLIHEADGSVEASTAGVNVVNVVITADFYPPYRSNETLWDIGLFFRDQGRNDELRMYIDSSGAFDLVNRIGEEDNFLYSGNVENLNLAPNTPNTLILMVWEESCVFFLNGQFIAEVDISIRMNAGDIAVVTNIDPDYVIEGAEVTFQDFTIYAVPLQ